MKLASNAFQNSQPIPTKFTCQGQNINPQLSWTDPPQDTQSFALIVDDPDAPAGTWVHWLVKDIPKDTNEIKEDQIPGKEVINDFGKPGYGGPCPPSGTHRYFFKLFALKEAIKADTKEEFYQECEKNKLEQATLMGTYQKT